MYPTLNGLAISDDRKPHDISARSGAGGGRLAPGLRLLRSQTRVPRCPPPDVSPSPPRDPSISMRCRTLALPAVLLLRLAKRPASSLRVDTGEAITELRHERRGDC